MLGGPSPERRHRPPPPVITVQPTNQTVLVGGHATFVVEATSGMALTYQWYFQSNAIPGATNNNGATVAAQVVTGVYPLLVLAGQWLPAGGFQVEFHTYPDTIYSILASTNLADWVTLITTNSGAGHVLFMDQDAALYPQRFYRSMQGP